MLKFDILDDFNFGMSYLFHPKSILTEFVGLDFILNIVFVIKISAQSKML